MRATRLASRVALIVGVVVALTGCLESAPAEDGAPAAVIAPLEEASFAGRFEDENLLVAIVTGGSGAQAYVCDGERDFWFRGEAFGLPLVLTASDGTELYVQRAEGGLAGAITFDDGTELSFTAPRTEESSLFRGETSVGEDTFLGGWIVLPDGEQRGVVRENGIARTSRIDTSGVVIVDATRSVSRLTPRRFVPGALVSRTPNEPIDLNLVGMGDSYGAGEGAPEIAGAHGPDGFATAAGESEETWDVDATGDVPDYTVTIDPPPGRTREAPPSRARIAEACHRSGASGFEVAADTLAEEWPEVAIDRESFACSGAKTQELLTARYTGPGGSDELVGWALRPQLEQLELSLAERPRDVDGIAMSIGGNDMGFVPIMAACLADPACAGAGSIARNILADGADGVATQYDEIGAALAEARIVSPRDVFLTAYPSPVRQGRAGSSDPSRSELCSSVSLVGWPSLLEVLALTSAEIAFADSVVVGTLNSQVREAAARNGFRVVDSHLAAFALHGWCSPDPWTGTVVSGLHTQGADIGNFQVLDGLGFDAFVGVPLTGGLAHPNAAGFREGYGPAIADAFRGLVRARVRPARPSGLRVAAQTANGAIVVRWDDRSSTETDFRVRLTRLGGDVASEPSGEIVWTEEATEYEIDARGRATYEVSIEACHTGVGVEACSAPTASLRVTNFPPVVVPGGLFVRNEFCNRGCLPGRVMWAPVDDPTFAHLFYEVEVDGVVIATQQTFLDVGEAGRFRVRSCNLTGCGRYSPFHVGPRSIDTTSDIERARDQACGELRANARRPGEPTPDPAGICR